VICTATIIVLSATSIVLGWLVHHQGKAMEAQKTALEATKATVDALKTQSDLRIEPLKDTINSKEGAIQALEAQLSASVERKTLAEEKLRVNQEQWDQLKAQLPIEMNNIIRAEVDREKASVLQAAGNLFYNAGYYMGLLNLSALTLQIQALAFARIEKENLEGAGYAVRAAAEYMKDSVLFLHRERRIALEQCVNLVSGPGIVIPAAMREQLEQASTAERLATESGLVMASEVQAISSLQGFPVDLASLIPTRSAT
jgi:hypothetical protein